MLETEKQRRWWFATHPEYSSRSTGSRTTKQEHENEVAAKGESGSLGERLSRYMIEHYPDAGVSTVRWPRIATPEELSRWPKEVMLKFLRSLNAVLQSTPLLMDPEHMKAAHALTKELIERMAQPGPGRWIEIARAWQGLEHQSKMSGFPIAQREGKHYIFEYEVVNPATGKPVRFDDYRDGILYEYKARQGNLLNKDKVFYDGIEGAIGLRNDALRQMKAAQGIPVVWRVGADQVKAFKKAVGEIPGLSIVP